MLILQSSTQRPGDIGENRRQLFTEGVHENGPNRAHAFADVAGHAVVGIGDMGLAVLAEA